MIYKVYYTHIKLCTQLKIVKILISVQLKINIKKNAMKIMSQILFPIYNHD